ncbi:MAG: hypothetical protein Ct9H300mP16_07320 [Pseudomonadota bacterium]|nr:MAG: hypothetical protein Ct9H300mP16_07320 [Pseudomonadota bacterium]
MNTQPIRICYQSYVDYENGKTYWDTLGAYLEKITYPYHHRYTGYHALRLLRPQSGRDALCPGDDLQWGCGRT